MQTGWQEIFWHDTAIDRCPMETGLDISGGKRRSKLLWQISKGAGLLQMAQIDAVLPQIIFLYRFDDLIKRRSKGVPVLWQGPLELKCVRCA